MLFSSDSLTVDETPVMMSVRTPRKRPIVDELEAVELVDFFSFTELNATCGHSVSGISWKICLVHGSQLWGRINYHVLVFLFSALSCEVGIRLVGLYYIKSDGKSIKVAVCNMPIVAASF